MDIRLRVTHVTTGKVWNSEKLATADDAYRLWERLKNEMGQLTSFTLPLEVPPGYKSDTIMFSQAMLDQCVVELIHKK